MGRRDDETDVDTATKATLAQAIRGSTDAVNPFVRDAIPNTVAGGTCTRRARRTRRARHIPRGTVARRTRARASQPTVLDQHDVRGGREGQGW